jgi:uncharacterized protein (TIGR02453 family)
LAFEGFPKSTLTFLRGLTRSNTKGWFEAHRADYDESYIEPAKEFVVALGERLQRFEPAITADPRVNKTIFRINRDTRFSKDKTRYRNHLDLWFYDGEKRQMGCSGFFFRLLSTRVIVGAGIHQFDKGRLTRFRKAVDDEQSGKVLLRLLKQVTSKGYAVGGLHYKKVPHGYDPGHARADLLRHNSLHAALETKLPDEIHSKTFVKWCADHCKKMQPIHR